MDFSVHISMESYIKTVLEALEVTKTATTPAKEDIFEVTESEVLDAAGGKEFHSVVMQLMYLAKRARPDILLPVNFLSSRVQQPTQQDKDKLWRVLEYLKGSADYFLRLSMSEGLRVDLYTDIAFAVHTEMQSQQGVVITLGGGCVYAKSGKQKVNTKSTTESELVGMVEGLPQGVWTRNFLESLGYDFGESRAVVVHQDNMGTEAMVAKGRPTSSRTRHMHIRYFFAHDLAKRGEISSGALSD